MLTCEGVAAAACRLEAVLTSAAPAAGTVPAIVSAARARPSSTDLALVIVIDGPP
jgi:hypothetical protein